MASWPETLLVESDLDMVDVTLGPSQRITAWEGLGVILGSMALGGSLAAGGSLFLGGLLSVVGVSAGGWVRMRGWVRHEAPLHLRLRPGTLELRRVYRERLLHLERIPLERLARVEASASGLHLVDRDGSVRELVTGFRNAEELAWVAGFVTSRVEDQQNGAVDARLEALRTEA